MPINISSRLLCAGIPLKRLQRSLQKVSTELGLEDLEINFQLVSDREIQVYNRRYLQHDRPTDVIAFEMNEGGVLGDVLISVMTAKRQARSMGHSLLQELQTLAIHGVLHLVGYRDKKKAHRDRMWKKTEKLLDLVRNLR